MALVTQLPENKAKPKNLVHVRVDRHQLEKRRWRAQAEDGKDIAVDLEKPCVHGDTVLATDDCTYEVLQEPEEVIVVDIPDNPDEACGLGWFFGNQHLSIQIDGRALLLADDPLLRKRLEERNLPFRNEIRVFNPAPHSRAHHH